MNNEEKVEPLEGAPTVNNGGEKENGKSPEENWREKFLELEKKHLYLYSDFENFRRRAEAERLNYIKFGHESFLRDLLEILDNFERGLQHAKSFQSEKSSPLAQITQGLEMIHMQFLGSLKAQGVTDVKALGEKFNPALHEAIGQEHSETAEPQTILREQQRGYSLHGRLLRPARVVTATKPEVTV